ncbi:hypothetical protein HK097_011703 [Rhizophlyctis rosea]|uniref:F-box domain-containing protein n=1 Tax=Rhizophlyctis rosea TaxID=64517 RepID=A0AAD5S8Q8_9FUNG|nr:hypothetical protein HK097_011703 [Rhizophlyctis rosea]
MLITALPAETLYRIFLELDSPQLLCKTLPRACRTFQQVIHSRAITISANVDLRSEEDDELGACSALIQPPGPLKLLNRFRKTVVPLPPSPEASAVDNADEILTPISATPFPIIELPTVDNEHKPRRVIHIAAEREIRVHLAAITDNPESLVNYLTDLLRQGVHSLGSAKGHRNVKVVFGTVEIKGRRGRCSADLLGALLGAMRPLKVILWHWDTELIRGIPGSVAPPMLRLPNMKSDSHVKRADLALLSNLTSLERLELFRPLPRQPWGLEGSGFASLSHLQNLRELVITPGRLIGGQNLLTDALMSLQNLEILELPWNIEPRLAANLLQGLPNLTHFQVVNVSR